MIYPPTISETSTGSPVKFERAGAIWHKRAIEGQSLGSCGWGTEIDEAIPSIATIEDWSVRYDYGEEPTRIYVPRKLVADHLHTNGLAHIVPNVADEVLINPWLKLTHPAASLVLSM